MAQGMLEKMQIIAYSDAGCQKQVGEPFKALINPESYTLDYKVVFNDAQAPGTSGAQPRYAYTPPEEMQFEFLFDSTGLLGNSSLLDKAIGKADSFLGTGGLIGAAVDGIFGDDGVYKEVENFKKMLLEYDSDPHEVKHFKLVWGKFIFTGRCTGISITYRLFNPDGTPIRATCKVSFKGSVEETLRIAKEDAHSPDITHYRIVKQGDTLPNMCYNVYGDSKYYLDVARANGLTDFRKLHSGDELFFPPIAKTKSS